MDSSYLNSCHHCQSVLNLCLITYVQSTLSPSAVYVVWRAFLACSAPSSLKSGLDTTLNLNPIPIPITQLRKKNKTKQNLAALCVWVKWWPRMGNLAKVSPCQIYCCVCFRGFTVRFSGWVEEFSRQPQKVLVCLEFSIPASGVWGKVWVEKFPQIYLPANCSAPAT